MTFFGEIKPLSSRAVDDEEADNQPNYEVSIKKTEVNVGLNQKFKLIVFSVGDIASIFVKSHFLSDSSFLMSTVKYSAEELNEESTLYTGMRSSKYIKDVNAVSVFASSNDILICEVSNSVPEEICYEVTELVFKNYSASEVLIFTSRHMATFKKESPLSYEMPFLKALGTSQYIANYSCTIPRLDAPNFLSKMPASLLLKCEISKVSALCVINYVDSDMVDSLNVQVFDEILKEKIVSKVPVNNDAKSKVVKYVKEKMSLESTLYT